MASEPAQACLLWAILFLSLPVTCGHTIACRSPALDFSAAIHFAMKRSAPCSAVLRHSPPVLGCSRPLVGVDAESSEVVQETLHLFFFLLPHAVRASPSPPSSPNIRHFGSLVSSMRARNPANKIRLLRIIASRLSLPVLINVSS